MRARSQPIAARDARLYGDNATINATGTKTTHPTAHEPAESPAEESIAQAPRSRAAAPPPVPPPGQPAETGERSKSEGASGWIQASRFSYVGLFFGVAVFLGFLFGRWLDGKFGTAPWLMLVGVLFGIASGFKELYRLTASYRTDQKKNQQKK